MPNAFRDQLQQALGTAYTLEHELGGGGMSHVFVATESALGRRVVVKVLPPDMAGSISVERFKREIAVAARLQHAHIVPVLTAGEAAGQPYYTMPFVDGESLRARLTRGGELPLGEAVRVLREVASALAFAHDHGIVHRDIKPDNVLIAGDSAMVTDFGVAKAVSASATDASSGITSIGVALGTPAYMAPEQATADPLVDHRADIYAFGCLAYELLTGQPPFAGRPTAAMLAAHVTDEPEAIDRRRPSVSPSLAALVMRCLEKRPADRPQQASEIVRVLDEITTPSGGSAPTSVRMPAAPAAAAPSLSRRAIAIAGTVVVALAAVFLATRGLPNRAESQPSTGAAALAVLPLSTEGDTASEFFADGMTEELTSALTKVQGLGVVSQTLSAATVRRNPDADVRAVGRLLNVGAVLEGSVRRSGGRLRVTAQLTNVADGRLLWSESYQGSSEDVFQVQDSIARSIVNALRGTLGMTQAPAIAVAGTRDPRAHELMLRARYNFTNRIRLDTAIVMVREALARDSSYAEAWSLLASIYTVLDLWSNAKADTSVLRAQEYARKALSIDSTLTEAWAALGNVLVDAGRFSEAMSAYDRGIALNPGHAQIHHWRGILLAALGRRDEALRDFQMSHTLDPIAPNAHVWYTWALAGVGRTDDALREAQAILETAPTFTTAAHFSMAAIYAHLQQPALAAAHADTAAASFSRSGLPDGPAAQFTRGIVGAVYARTNRIADARAQLAALRATTPAARSAHYGMALAAVYLGLGFPDSALSALEDNFDDLTATQFGVMEVSLTWRSEQLTNHPRYQQLLRRARLRE
ncbi:MAG TPA: protein kinase [Gemmatimonadaceae bacterium]